MQVYYQLIKGRVFLVSRYTSQEALSCLPGINVQAELAVVGETDVPVVSGWARLLRDHITIPANSMVTVMKSGFNPSRKAELLVQPLATLIHSSVITVSSVVKTTRGAIPGNFAKLWHIMCYPKTKGTLIGRLSPDKIEQNSDTLYFHVNSQDVTSKAKSLPYRPVTDRQVKAIKDMLSPMLSDDQRMKLEQVILEYLDEDDIKSTTAIKHQML